MSNTRPHNLGSVLAIALAFTVAGCSIGSSTAKRSGIVALGAAGGGAAAHALGDGDPVKTVAGAAAGGLLTSLALGEDEQVRQQGFDQGYIHGQSDAIKRQYFLRQALERQPLTSPVANGEPVYYVMPGPEVTVDGRKLAPHTVAVRVME